MLNWSLRRLLAFLTTVWFLILEPVSWITSRFPPCIVSPENYGRCYAEENECPALHIVVAKLFARIFEILADPHNATAAFTGLLFFATIALWYSTSRLVKEAKAASERQLRAYVSIEVAGLSVSRSGNAFFLDIGYSIANAGQTPAYKVRTDSAFPFLPWPLPKNEKIQTPPPNAIAFEPTIGPKQSKTGTIKKLGAVSIDSISGNRRLYIVVVVTYEDAFGKNRYTEYCSSMENLPATLNAFLAGKSAAPTIFSLSEQHNKAT